MPSPSSKAQAAREAVAARLREIRLDAGITARELAARCGWSESKSSRIEHAKTPPGDADIRSWCAACGVPELAEDLIASNRQADSMYVQWKRLQRTGLRQLQESGVPLYEQTRQFHVYCSNVVPGFFQTPEYATALLTSIARFRGTPDDVEEAVSARIKRSRVIREGDHRFAVLVEEAVLRYRIGGAEVMAAQLGHLLSVMALPSISLGIIPFTAPRPAWPLETFTIFDRERVHVETLSAAIRETQPSDVALYMKAFANLKRAASYGPDARALITSAISFLDARG
ncbi:helix-turn-helix domain-containing protein [Streptomyces globosus]|jgi:transcriptional regulator with XRE-family HTH domain|uniref:helix-turn-helix domain-containing protein n=1 Tax=Streptomyces TaxID=1883 RepID=UPI000F74A0D3|nr:helix-turn-helix transcriptional regulator [Streptomyces sp. WAC05292]RSS85253.1 XRE family transcriptional regulator [Streptomyces sp. WAC05292]